MIQIKKITLLGLASLLVATTLFSPVNAQEATENILTEQKVSIIRANCQAAQGILQRVQRNDIVTRTNRGRSYEATLTLMAAFNSRAALNKINEPRLVQATAQLQSKFVEFYDHYTKHQNDLKAVLAIKCKEKPEEFYQLLTTARSSRIRLKSDVDQMSVLIKDYGQIVRELTKTAPKQTGNSGEGE